MALRKVLLTCGLPDIKNIDGKRPTQAFINWQGFADIDNFSILEVKDVPYMIKNHNSIHDQSVILGAVHQKKNSGAYILGEGPEATRHHH